MRKARDSHEMPNASAGFSVDWNSRPPKIVQVSGNAADAGLQAGDVLSEIDGNKTEDALSVLKLIGAKQPGDYIIVKVLRARKPLLPRPGHAPCLKRTNLSIIDDLRPRLQVHLSRSYQRRGGILP